MYRFAGLVLALMLFCGRQSARADNPQPLPAAPTVVSGLVVHDVGAEGLVIDAKERQRHPVCHWFRAKFSCCGKADINSVGCASLKAECTFIFGSCRQFFGECSCGR